MAKAGSILRASISDIKAVDHHCAVGSLIDRIAQKISKMELPGAEHFERYMRHKWRMNHEPQSLMGSFQAVRGFLGFYCSIRKSQLQEIVSGDLEAFVEHEQDRGLKVASVKTRLNYIWAFVRFLIEREIVEESILRRKIKLRVPDFLPRAIAPGDVRKILACIKDTRDRAFVLVLLRTGMRIGELLGLKMRDLDVREKKIHIYEGEKNCLGRVVYLSDDALMALQFWLRKRDKRKEYLFYGVRTHLCYTAAWDIFTKYLRETGFQHKGYTMHSLRHYAEFLIMPSYI